MTDPRNILITGGTDGIGLLMARSYARSGANVVVTGRRDKSALSNVLPANVSYIEADQSVPEQAARFIDQGLEQLGWQHCDLAILNAGNGKFCDPLDENSDDLSNRIDVNLTAPILIALQLTKLLVAAPDGKLVFIGSTSYRGAKKFASYAAAKSGLNGFVRSLREEWLDRVNVQIIHPGPIATNMHAKAEFNPGFIKNIFLDPDFVTRTIIRKIESGRSPVIVSFTARIIDILSLRGWMS